VTWENASARRVPSGALFQRGSVWQAFVLESGRARLREVKPGRGNGIDTEVLDGLRDGDRVIVYPGDKVADGTRVAPLEIGVR
jgi:HlyD family secretion protein